MIASNIFIYLRLQIIHFFSLFLKRGFIEIFRIKENDFIKFTAIIYVKFQISKCRRNLHRYFYKNEKKIVSLLDILKNYILQLIKNAL